MSSLEFAIVAGSKDLSRQIRDIEREIDSIREERHWLDLALRSADLKPSPPRRLYIRFTIRGLDRRLALLGLRRNVAYNVYLQLCRDEARKSRQR